MQATDKIQRLYSKITFPNSLTKLPVKTKKEKYTLSQLYSYWKGSKSYGRSPFSFGCTQELLNTSRENTDGRKFFSEFSLIKQVTVRLITTRGLERA